MRLRFEKGMSVTADSMEFNVLGVGHEFWIGAEAGIIIATAVLAGDDSGGFRILRLEVAPSRKKEGVGSSLLRAIMDEYPDRDLSVVPSDGTEGFYRQLGFSPSGRWQMKLNRSKSKR